MRARLSLLAGIALASVGLADVARGGDWPQFRGPGGSATAAGKALPDAWGADKNVAWKTEVAGYGWSCPVVWGDKVFVTSAFSEKQQKPTGSPGAMGGMAGGPGGGRGGMGGFGGFGPQKPPDAVYRWDVVCLSAADGRVLWKRTAAEKKPTIPKHGTNTYASETPVTDGERVYAYFGMTGVFCYDLDGNPLWKADLGSYPTAMGFGTGSSPVLEGGRLFVQCDNEQKSFLVALDAKSGKELWRTERPERTGWSTPLVWKNRDRTEIVCLGSPKVRSYDPATGQQLWEMAGMAGQMKASAAAGPDLLFVGSGGMGGFGEDGPGGMAGSPGGGRPGGFGGFGGMGGFGTPPRPGLILPEPVQTRLELTDAQKKRVEELQKEIDNRLDKLLTEEQRKQLKDLAAGGGRPGGPGGFGPPGGFGGMGGFGGFPGMVRSTIGPRPLVAVKPGASGDITLKEGQKTNASAAWSLPNAGPATPSPLFFEGHLYILDDRGGFLSCHDAATGKQLYRERLPRARGFTSSPWACAGKVYCLDDGGTTHVVRAGPKFEVLGRNAVDGLTWSSPAVAGGAVYLRTVDHLYCFREPAAK